MNLVIQHFLQFKILIIFFRSWFVISVFIAEFEDGGVEETFTVIDDSGVSNARLAIQGIIESQFIRFDGVDGKSIGLKDLP